jgi:hypothetical protein
MKIKSEAERAYRGGPRRLHTTDATAAGAVLRAVEHYTCTKIGAIPDNILAPLRGQLERSLVGSKAAQLILWRGWLAALSRELTKCIEANRADWLPRAALPECSGHQATALSAEGGMARIKSAIREIVKSNGPPLPGAAQGINERSSGPTDGRPREATAGRVGACTIPACVNCSSVCSCSSAI